MKKTMHIGIDDTDSTRKGCTTYVAALLVERLERLQARFVDYPNLIRLNPNVPWKTRGNGALCLRITHDTDVEEEIKETVVRTAEEHSDLEWIGTDPGIVFLSTSKVPRDVKSFAKEAITSVVTLDDALGLIRKYGAEALGFKNGRGIIGGLAAIGETLEGDHTYELLAYRMPENCGTKRKVSEASIFKMDKATAPYTYNNVDEEKRRVIMTPHGPDPILLGVRGDRAETVRKAFTLIHSLEPVERWVIFRTNQGTDAHLKHVEKLASAKAYNSIIAEGTVSTNPTMTRGKHVIFRIRDDSGDVDCAAYEPTGALRKIAMRLSVGDSVRVCGAVKAPGEGKPLTVNLEKMQILHLTPQYTHHNPLCRKCGKRLKSMGKGQDLRCGKCGSRYPREMKTATKIRRDLKRGLYFTAARSQRHLAKPLRRYGLEKRRGSFDGMIEAWHFP